MFDAVTVKRPAATRHWAYVFGKMAMQHTIVSIAHAAERQLSISNLKLIIGSSSIDLHISISTTLEILLTALLVSVSQFDFYCTIFIRFLFFFHSHSHPHSWSSFSFSVEKTFLQFLATRLENVRNTNIYYVFSLLLSLLLWLCVFRKLLFCSDANGIRRNWSEIRVISIEK